MFETCNILDFVVTKTHKSNQSQNSNSFTSLHHNHTYKILIISSLWNTGYVSKKSENTVEKKYG